MKSLTLTLVDLQLFELFLPTNSFNVTVIRGMGRICKQIRNASVFEQ